MTKQVLVRESDKKLVSDSKRPIPMSESDFKDRLLDAIGNEPVNSFARRCGIGESLLRGYVKKGAKPGLEYLVAIADAANVSIEWLAAGRGPKQRGASVHALPTSVLPHTPITFDDFERLSTAVSAVEEGLAGLSRSIAPNKKAEIILAAYKLLHSQDAESRAGLVRMLRLAA